MSISRFAAQFRSRPTRLLIGMLAGMSFMPASARLHAVEPQPAHTETTLPMEPSVSVDLTASQREAEHAAALERARIVASMPGAAEREAIVPEIMLIQRKALADLAVTMSQPQGPAQIWRLRSTVRPDLYAERVIPRLLRAGFSTTPACPGEEWSGSHGKARVAVRVEERAVAVVLTPATLQCAGGAAR
jgi:hypothetical protein